MNIQDINLQALSIPTDSGPNRRLADNSTESVDGSIMVYFRNIELRLIEHIQRSQMVVGCVAWLTSDAILHALAQVPGGVSIIVQKEDFLRPDIDRQPGWKSNLRQLYDHLKQVPERHMLGGLAGQLSVCGDPTVDSVRCVGNFNRDKKPAFPRMHNKFLVFCDIEDDSEWWSSIKPHTVWTGSFNFTRNAGLSFENVLVVTNPSIAQAFYSEWEQILALSEPLNWDTDWCQPQWRIGT